MSREQMHDADMREPLFDFLDAHYGMNRILEEKTMGKSRADVVMVLPDKVVGIEIKSDADTYARLSRQVKDYDRYFDANIAVVGSHHGLHIEEHVLDYWGIITVEETEKGFDFYVLREFLPNQKNVLKKKMELLWRPELAAIQKQHDMPKYREKSRAFVTGKILALVPERIPVDVLNREISDQLFERDYTLADRERSRL